MFFSSDNLNVHGPIKIIIINTRRKISPSNPICNINTPIMTKGQLRQLIVHSSRAHIGNTQGVCCINEAFESIFKKLWQYFTLNHKRDLQTNCNAPTPQGYVHWFCLWTSVPHDHAILEHKLFCLTAVHHEPPEAGKNQFRTG